MTGPGMIFLNQNRVGSNVIEDCTFLAMSIVKYCSRFLRDIVDASSLETFEVRLDMALSYPADCTRVGQDDP